MSLQLKKGRAYLRAKEVKKAERIFANLYKRYKNTSFEPSILEDIANCMITKGNYVKASKYLVKAIDSERVDPDYQDRLKLKLAYCYVKNLRYKHAVYVLSTIKNEFVLKERRALIQKSKLSIQPEMLRKFHLSEIRKHGKIGLLYEKKVLFAYKVHLGRYFTTSQLYDSMRILAEEFDVLTLHINNESLTLYTKSDVETPEPKFHGMEFHPIDVIYPILPEIVVKRFSKSIRKDRMLVMRITELYENPGHDLDLVLQNGGTVVLSFSCEIRTTSMKKTKRKKILIDEGLSYLIREEGYRELINSRDDNSRGKFRLVDLQEKYLLRDVYMQTNHRTENMKFLYEKDTLSKHWV